MSETVKQYPSKPDRVYFFATCLVDLFYPEAGMAGIGLLEREGIEVVYPEGQTCCGQPAHSSGYHDQARAVAAHQLNLFTEPLPILVPSGSCGGMMRRHYPRLFAGTALEDKANAVAARTWELTEFLLHVCHIKLQDLGKPEKVTLHTSCSARRELGLGDVGPALLAKLANVTLVEPERASECCGFGGTFAVTQPDISGAMVEDKVECLSKTGASHLLSTDCGCLMNITGCAEKRGRVLPGEHILSFLWHRTGGDKAS